MGDIVKKKSNAGRKKSDNPMDRSVSIKFHDSINSTLDFHVILFNSYAKSINSKIEINKSLLVRALVSKYLRKFPIPAPSITENELKKNIADIKDFILLLESALKQEQKEEAACETENERTAYRKNKVLLYKKKDEIDKADEQAHKFMNRLHEIDSRSFYIPDEFIKARKSEARQQLEQLGELVMRLRNGIFVEDFIQQFEQISSNLNRLFHEIEEKLEQDTE